MNKDRNLNKKIMMKKNIFIKMNGNMKMIQIAKILISKSKKITMKIV